MTSANLKFLLIGDIVARPGRRAVETVLPRLREEQEIDLVIANAENLAGGRGVTRDTLMEMMNAGVDLFTSGDHVFHNDDWAEILADDSLGILRPLNYYPDDLPGRGFVELKIKDRPVVVGNLAGSERMPTPAANPFVAADHFLSEHGGSDKIVLIDFHAELTSEKRALGFYLDGRAEREGRVNVIWGTHTHVPTADLQILPKGTFYVSDLGMVGTKDSVLGVKPEIIIRRFTHPARERFEWEYQGEKVFNSVLVELGRDGNIVSHQRIDRVIP